MKIVRCDIDIDCSSYAELKQRCVVAQGWPDSGDVSFMAEEDMESYWDVLREQCGNDDRVVTVFKALKGIEARDVFVAVEGTSIKGVCEIPERFSYVYDDNYDYANAVFPVAWVDWADFCESISTINRSPGPMKGIANEVARYINDHWVQYKQEKSLEVQPRFCDNELERILSERPEKIAKSKKIYRTMKEFKMNQPIKELLLSNNNIILTGAPGTGKTYTALAIAKELAGGDQNRIRLVQFHPGYDYSDFVMGLKPVLLDENGNEVNDAGCKLDENGNEVNDAGCKTKVSVSYRWKPGVFKMFADAATADAATAVAKSGDTETADTTKIYVLVIDEINRADLSRVFGELFSLIEKDYRGEAKVTLPNGEKFSVPKNLYIIGTMNDIDRSVDSMDFALRRRFAWYEVTAKSSERIIDAKLAHRSEDAEKLKKAMHQINQYISGEDKIRVGEREVSLGLGSEYQLGGAIFANAAKYTGDWAKKLWENHVKIILSEYLRGNREKTAILNALEAEYKNKIGLQA